MRFQIKRIRRWMRNEDNQQDREELPRIINNREERKESRQTKLEEFFKVTRPQANIEGK